MPRKISVTVAEDTPELIRRGAVPSPESVVTKTVELSTDVLRKQMGERLQDLNEVFSGIPDKVGDFEPSEVSISFAVSGTGEISLLSTLKGGLGITATFVLKLIRHGQK